MKLSELKTGETAVIVKIRGYGEFRHRITEMGFVKAKKFMWLNTPHSATQLNTGLWATTFR